MTRRKSYETTSRKINHLRNQNGTIRESVRRQKIKNSVINRAIKLRQPRRNEIKRLLSKSIDWVPLTSSIRNKGEESEAPTFISQYYEWKISLEGFDIRLLPFIEIKIIYREVGGETDDQVVLETDDMAIHYEITNLSQTHSDINIVVNWSFEEYGGLPEQVDVQYEAKLLIDILNPSDYV